MTLKSRKQRVKLFQMISIVMLSTMLPKATNSIQFYVLVRGVFLWVRHAPILRISYPSVPKFFWSHLLT